MTLLLAVCIALLYSYYYFMPHSAQQGDIFTYLLNHHYNGLLNVNYLNITEKRHLLDVKRLFANTLQLFQYSVLGHLTLLLLFRKKLSGLLLLQILVTTGGMIVITSAALISIFGFKEIFSLLHKPFFVENTWLFSEESTLIHLFPSEYFYQFLFIYTLIITTVLLLISRYAIFDD